MPLEVGEGVLYKGLRDVRFEAINFYVRDEKFSQICLSFKEKL